ncbi:MAG: OmpA family protein [Phaeodactylibacter sp.]|nr:OmpA family protein [Phaeodactylibacter sp.]
MLKKLRNPRLFPILCLLFSLLFVPALSAQPLGIFSVHFETDEDTLSQEARLSVAEKLQNLLPVQDYRAQLIGHTDRRGSLEYNQALSERRAASVRDRLEELGFNPDRIQATGRAYLDPLTEGQDEEALARNRRVDVIVEKVNWNVESAYFSLDSRQPAQLEYQRSGTKISIPAEAFQDRYGKAAKGDIILMYREFRDPADFIASGLPMNFNRQGQDVYFNSTGMFEIRAFDRAGNELELRKGKAADIDFVQAQVLEQTQFWRFDERLQSWDSGDALIEYEEGEMKRVQTGTENRYLGNLELNWPDSWRWSRKPDTISQLLEAYARLPQLLESAKNYDYQYVPELDPNRFKLRFGGAYVRQNYAGTRYVGHLAFEEAYNNPKYYNIELETLGRSGKKVIARIRDLSGENPELAAFEGATWILSPEGKKSLDEILPDASAGLRFCDIKISRKKRNRQYAIILKYKGSLIRLDARLEDINGERPSDETMAEAYIQYTRALRQRQQDFDRERDETLAGLNLFWPCVKLLLPKALGPDPFQIAGIQAAIGCNAKRGDNTLEWPGQPASNVRGILLDDMPGYTFITCHARFFRDDLVGGLSLADDWRQLISGYEASVNGDVPVYSQVYRLFEQPRPKLRLTGLGIFNLDVLKYFKEEAQLLARFKDENGQPIRHYRVDVVNHNLNGLLTFKEPSIYLDLKAPTTLIVYGEDGKFYWVSSTEMNQLPLKGKTSFTFTATALSDPSGRPETLRKLLSDS